MTKPPFFPAKVFNKVALVATAATLSKFSPNLSQELVPSAALAPAIYIYCAMRLSRGLISNEASPWVLGDGELN